VHGRNGLRGYDWMNPTVDRIMVDKCHHALTDRLLFETATGLLLDKYAANTQ